jgi:hypothetical protein
MRILFIESVTDVCHSLIITEEHFYLKCCDRHRAGQNFGKRQRGSNDNNKHGVKTAQYRRRVTSETANKRKLYVINLKKNVMLSGTTIRHVSHKNTKAFSRANMLHLIRKSPVIYCTISVPSRRMHAHVIKT